MEPNLSALIQASRDGRPSDFQTQVNDFLGQRVADALERRRQEMAQSIISHNEEDPIEPELESDEEINSDENQSNDDSQIEEPNGQDA